MNLTSSLAVYFHPKIIAVFLLGIASGLPLALTTSTLAVWMTELEVDLETIGYFALAGTPYAIKFLWAPLIDQLPLPLLTKLLGRRRAWLIFSQACLIISIFLLGASDPLHAPWATALFAVMVAFCSATQDIVIDAYRIDLLDESQQGAGATSVVYGWRIGALISGAGALFLAHEVDWFLTYTTMALIVLVGAAAAFWIGEPDHHHKVTHTVLPEWLKHTIIEPFHEFIRREQNWLLILIFIVLYKLGDAYAGVMTAPFVLDLGFDKTEYAEVVKLYGFIAGLIGAFIGGVLVHRYGIYRTLWISGILMMLSNLVFVAQAYAGYDTLMLIFTITAENVSGWMGNVVIVAYLSQLCNVKFSATQYALFSALAATGRTWLSASSGVAAEWLGWANFFIASTVIAIPSLVLLYYLGKKDKG